MKFALLGLLLVLSFSAFAGSQKLLVITNNIDTNIVTITLNDNSAGKFVSIDKVEKTAEGGLVNEERFDLIKLFTGPAVQVIKNKPVVKIRFDRSFDPAYGGHFVLDYLFSGISGERRTFDMDLSKNGVKWEVIVGNKPVTKLHFVGNKKAIVGTIGVARIESK